MNTKDILTPSELDYQMDLESTPLPDLLKMLADYTEREKTVSVALNAIKAAADQVEAIALQRMLTEDMSSITVQSDSGIRMRFSITSRTFPKMVAGSLAAAEALQRYANRLEDEEQYDEAQAVLDMLTIKGQSLAPMLNEWLLSEVELPPEFAGAIEASTRFSLSKRKA